MSGGQIGRPDLAPDFVLRMGLIALHHLFEMADGFRQPTLRSRDSAQLIVRVQLVRIDINRALKALARLIQFSALLMNQTQIVMR